ncbi:MAG: hypothetical protein OEV42_19020 [Deltaproteobacteria bacterium]|nr:hypothetical protein [Deltaproteobacteria bacterium]
MERRRDQFLDEQGYYVFVTPYSLPGLGSGAGLVGAVSNVNNSYADFYTYMLDGDLEGGGFALSDVHLLSKRLIVDLTGSKFRKILIQSFGARGIGGDKDDYTLLEMDENNFLGARLTGTFFDRMLEFYTMGYDGGWHISKLRDSDGNLTQDLKDSDTIEYGVGIVGMRIDYTDDYQNPRVGLRFDVSASQVMERERHAVDQYAMQYNLTGYIPLRRRDTLVLNYFQADAVVRSKGETDRAAVENIYGFNCAIGTPAEQQDCNDVVDNIISGNRYGTAGGLGGTSRMRAYPMSRFKGAHIRFAGVEYRWNITEESTPFNIWVAKDIRTSIQMAFFYEVAAVADKGSDLYDKYRSDAGIGVRMATEGGFVIRGDVAYGREGPGVSIIIGYPWESF